MSKRKQIWTAWWGHHPLVQQTDLPNLVYIQAVVKESLRLHPPAPVRYTHQSINACSAFGYDMSAKTCLSVNIWATGRDETVWPNPPESNPGRFMHDGPNASVDPKAGQHFELLSYGSGRRMCSGAALGNLMLRFFVASLLHSFHWRITADPGMAEAGGAVLQRAVPLRVTAKRRLASELYNI